jgi:hypothetical protein
VTAQEAIAKADELLERCTVHALRAHSFDTWRRIEREQREAAEVMAAIPCPDTLGREEIDPDTWRA